MPLRTLMTPLLVIALCSHVHAMQAIDTTRVNFGDRTTGAINNRIETKARLRERITPSIALQYLRQGNYILIDATVALKYEATDKFAIGAGWNRRIAYNVRYDAFSNRPRTFGPRCFATYKMHCGLSPRMEFELMNSPVPPIIQKITDEYSDRQWVPALFIGFEKEYILMKRVQGSCAVLLRTFNCNNKSPYGEVVNVRFGFDFPAANFIRKRESL